MSIKIYRLIFLTIGILLVIEMGLEFRAYHKGWKTIIGGLISPDSKQVNKGLPTDYGPTDNFPFRSLIVPIEKPPGISRLWIASASYAQDNYTKASQIFPNLLEKKLDQSGFPVQVLNAAQEGQSIEGNIRILKQIAAPWKPDFILLYEMNLDISELSQEFCSNQSSNSNTKHDIHEKEPPLRPKVSWGEKFFERSTVYQLLKENITANISQSRILVPELGKDADTAFRQRIYDFIDLSHSMGAVPILCTFSTSHDLHHQKVIPVGAKNFMLRYDIYLSVPGWFKAIDEFNDDIREIGKEKNVLVIDLNRTLSGHPEYFRDFVHFTPEGHQMMAKTIAEKLLENKGRPKP